MILRSKANLKSYVLRRDLKIKKRINILQVSWERIPSAFKSVGADTLKDLSPEEFFIFPVGCNKNVPEFIERSE